MSGKRTGKKAASDASHVLRDGRTSAESKSAAGSTLSQAGKGGKSKHTSDDAAEAASEVLQDKSTGPKSKSAAASALSQSDKKD